MDLKYLLILTIVLATIEINVTESRQNDKRRWKNDKGFYSHYVNICDIQDRVSKVHCYCESIKLKSATRADCWVFNGGIAEDDPFWSNFYSQPNIERLTFNVRADGGLTFVPAKVIVRLDRLQYLNIQYANIYSIPSFAFTNSTTLREIILPKNKIAKLERMAFAHLIMLSNVSLVENQITELKRDVFYVLPNLQRLHLSKNNIGVLHDGCFKHLDNLIELDLDSNLLTVLIRENFQGLSNLISLDMRNNKLAMIGDLAFAELWSLQELYLDGNEIEFISQRGFGGLTNLKKLSLADNKLASLDDGVFEELSKLMVLDLKNNILETLNKEVVQNVFDNMKSSYSVIALDGNQLTCDCRLSWIYKLRNETRSKRLKLYLDRLSCVMDTEMNQKIDITKTNEDQRQDLNIQGNSLKERYASNIKNTEKAYDENQDEFEDRAYDEAMQDQDTDVSAVKSLEHKKKLLEIPTEQLPCPHRLIHSDESHSPPTQDEVKYFPSSGKRILASISFISLATFFL